MTYLWSHNRRWKVFFSLRISLSSSEAQSKLEINIEVDSDEFGREKRNVLMWTIQHLFVTAISSSLYVHPTWEVKALLWLEFLLLNKILLFKIAVKSDLFKLLRNNLLVGALLSRYTWQNFVL